ncbi:DNA cytosine methyltransferase [Serratia ureilytica]|uniref:DNA cytosine methyltransferase n=1 Tax=Serratia ureilytica TaxID=300181 RepID=UPI0018D67396|nr:DNA cytosine methyltransferase [Serratia ureilytica]MBH2883543.1 DNA cytosine methyltransferase [Serratia ureilytica]MBH3123823.1 DNA cytosine methyltransferase [Serratia ureilytica]
MVLKAISLFSGAGGMDVGVANAGFDIIAANELDPHACKTYRENHQRCTLYEGDIEQHIDILKKYMDVDLIIGGPPCQGFSVAGKMDPKDPRSKLVFTYCKVVESVRPKAFIMENVKSLGSLSKFQPIREEIFRQMENLGYSVSMVILNAKDFGVPQSRERVFFIGVKGQSKLITLSCFDKYKEKAVSLRDAISHLGKAGTANNKNITKAKITLAEKPVLRKSPYAGMLFNGQGRPLNPDAWSSTLPASMGGNRTPIIDEEHLYDNKPSWVESYHKDLLKGAVKSEYKNAPPRLRRLTVDEAIILQTFPSDYKFLGPQSKVFSQIGNAVPCKLAQVVATVVKDILLGGATSLDADEQLSLLSCG